MVEIVAQMCHKTKLGPMMREITGISGPVIGRPFSIMLAFFSPHFLGKRAFFFSFFLEKELLAFSVIFHDCDPDFSTQKDTCYLCV